jgi:dTDP-4-amino-4,6-dideoxygalactose transaminase
VTVPFLDFAPAHEELKPQLEAAFQRVVASKSFILGDELEAFEEEFARFCGASYCIGVGNGMDALAIALRALDIGVGDEVITVSHTAFPTVAAIAATGATPVLVDVSEDSFCMDPESLSGAFTTRSRAIVPVHLYGRCADMTAILALAAEAGIPVIEDAAQAHGATYDGRMAGTLGVAGAFSFYPTKNLGALGDAGALVTDDANLAQRARCLRNYGEQRKYLNVVSGQNSRLDELQAAILRVKLPHLARWNRTRRTIAARYTDRLTETPVQTPGPHDGHVYHLYVIRSSDRDQLQRHLSGQGIGTQIHYPRPVHRQPACERGVRLASSMKVTEKLAGEILSLPAYPGLHDEQIDEVALAITQFPRL